MSSQTTQPDAEIRQFPTMKAVPDEQPRVEAPAAAETPVRKRRSARGVILPIIGAALLCAGAWYGYQYWTVGRFMVSTDDAYVQADMAFISPKVSGYVDKVNVIDNQHVKAGEPLVVIDNGDYRIALEQAEAQIASQQKTLERIDAQVKAGQASLLQAEAQKASAQAAATNAQRTLQRNRQLVKTHVFSQSQLDDAETAVDQANAALAGADAQIVAAKANIGVLQAQYAEAKSSVRSLELARDKAARDLSFTVLRAPYDGVIGNRAVQKGDLVSPGQKLAVVVPVSKLYIVANFKETQLSGMVPGEKVKVRVDAISGQHFDATVSSLAPASGSVFSMLPPENATGNFTKVVQRVPVRIDLPQDVLKSERLRAGLSVIVDVDSRTAPDATARR